MMTNKAWARSGLMMGAALLLAACGSSSETAVGQACPTVTVVSDTARMVQLAPGASQVTPANTRFLAEIADFASDCRLRNDGQTVEVNLTLRIAAEKGQAAGTMNSVNAPFYVAIAMRPDQTILAKEVFSATFDFAGTQTRSGSTEELVQRIPMPEGKRPGDYEIIVGFQLTPEQLQINRTRRGL